MEQDQSVSSGLSEEEKKQPKRSNAFLRYFQDLESHDKLLMICGLLGAVIAGVIMPSISLVMANIAMAFSGTKMPDNGEEKQDLAGKIFYVSGLVLCIAAGIAINSYIFFAFW